MTTKLEKLERPVVASSSLGALPAAVQAFRCRNGEAHLLFACHAALPLGLTPELLYSLWANFQTDCQSKSLDIPWVATADLLLSNLCEEVGAGLYEMLPHVRAALVDCLERDSRFELKRIREIAAFLSTYVQPQLNSENLDVRDFAQTQNWLSTAYLRPEKAAEELSATLANAFQQKSDDLLRVASIVNALKKPLADYPDLLAYARGMANYAQGDIEAAQKVFDQLRASAQSYDFSSEGIPLPSSTQQKTEVEQKQASRNLPIAVQIMASLAVGSVASGGVWGMRSHMPDRTLVAPIHSSLPTEIYVSKTPHDALSLDQEGKYVVVPKPARETDPKPLPEAPNADVVANADVVELSVHLSPSDYREMPGVSNDSLFPSSDSDIVIDDSDVDAANKTLPVGSLSSPMRGSDICLQCDDPTAVAGESIEDGSRDVPPVGEIVTDGEITNGDDAQPSSNQANGRLSLDSEVLPLNIGAEGEAVRALQLYLRRVGLFNNRSTDSVFPINGIYGQETADAVSDYQRTRALPETGIADDETLRDMELHVVLSEPSQIVDNTNAFTMLSSRTIALNDSGTDTRILQNYLASIGLYSSSVDGIYGQEVADAVADYQRIRNLPSTGIANEETLRDMNFGFVESAGLEEPSQVQQPDSDNPVSSPQDPNLGDISGSTHGVFARVYSVEGGELRLKRANWDQFYRTYPNTALLGDDLLQVSPGSNVVILCSDGLLRYVGTDDPNSVVAIGEVCPEIVRKIR